MKLYAELPQRRFRQLAADAAVLGWTGLWVLAGMRVHDLVGSLASAGNLLIEAGTDLEENTSSVQGTVARVPVIGSFLQDRFDGLAGAGRSLRESGMSQVETVESLALWVGFLVALLPIMLVLWAWGTRRMRWIRDATAAARLRSDPANLYLFALRAVVTAPFPELGSRASLEGIRSFHDGDYRPLADLALRRMGLRSPKSLV